MLSTRRFGAMLAIGAAVAVPIAGCGGSSSNDNTGNNANASQNTSPSTQATTGGGAAATGPGGSVSLTASDYKFSPSDPTVKSGKVSFNLKNDSQTTAHSLEVEDVTPGHDQELEGEVSPGQTGNLTVSLKPGKYEFYCPIDNHKELGMEGEITVK